MGKVVGGYRFVKTIGIGSLSKTKIGVHMTNGKLFAIKEFPSSYLDNDLVITRLAKLSQFRSPFYSNIVEVLKSETHGFIVSELSNGGELFSYINDFTDMRLRVCFLHLIDALLFTHGQGLFIGDLKPEKLVVSDDFNLKLTDFSLSSLVNAESHLEMSSGPYSAPERQKSAYSDIYSAGLILYSLLTKRIPGSTLDFAGVPQGAVDLITKMTVRSNPEGRISLNEVKQNEWINGRRDDISENGSSFNIRNVVESSLEDEISKESELTAFEIVGKAMSVDLKSLLDGPNSPGRGASSFIVEDTCDAVLRSARAKMAELNCRIEDNNKKPQKGNDDTKAFVASFDVNGKTVLCRVEVLERNLNSSEVVFCRLRGEPLDFLELFTGLRNRFAE